MCKKRWYDGLHDIYEDKDEFEIKFGCFGGDGGSKGGPKTDPKPAPTSTPGPDDGFRGEQSAARGPSVAETAAAAAAAGLGSGYGPGTKSKAEMAKDIQGKVADAVAASQKGPVSLDTSMQNMSIDQAFGLGVPSVAEQLATPVGLPGKVAPAAKSLADMYADAQKAVADQAYSGYQSQPNQATKNYMEYQTNAPVQPTNNPTYGFTVDAPPNVSLQNPGLQLNFSAPLGLQTSATPDITQSGIMNALGVPSSYQTAALAPTSVTSPINDPMAQAGVGSFFTETVPGVFGYTTPAKAKSYKSKAKANADRFKNTKVRTKPTGVGEFFSNINPFG